MKIFFCALLLLPLLAQAEMYQCEEHSHTVYQSWPCNAVLHRPPPPAPQPAPARLAMNVQTQNQQDTSSATQQNKQPRMSEEERLYYEHKNAIADTSQNPAIRKLKELFK